MIATSPKKNPCFYGTPLLPPPSFISSSCARPFLPPCPCLRFAQVPPWGIDPWVLGGQKIYPPFVRMTAPTPLPIPFSTSPPPPQNPNLSRFPGLCSFPWPLFFSPLWLVWFSFFPLWLVDAPRSSLLDPLEGLSMLNYGKLELEGRS